MMTIKKFAVSIICDFFPFGRDPDEVSEQDIEISQKASEFYLSPDKRPTPGNFEGFTNLMSDVGFAAISSVTAR